MRLDLGKLALIAGAIFILPKLLRNAPSATEALDLEQQENRYWIDAAGNIIDQPSLTPPPGAVRPASQYEIDQWSISQGGGMI